MRWTTTAAAGIVCTATALSAWPQAFNPVGDDDRANFEQDFGEKLRQVKKTRTTDDDRQLAIEMVEFAGQIPDSPGVRCLLYIEAIPLAAADGDITAAVFAADRLGSLWPGHAAADPLSLIPDAERAYRYADADERPAIAEPYLDLLLAAARRAEQDDDLDGAIRLCRDANLVARKVESSMRESIEDTLERLSQASEDLNEIRRLSLSLQDEPGNAHAARELVRLLVARRGDLATAADFATQANDPDLTEALSHCNAGLDQASGPAALFVADWYMTLADSEKDHYAESLLSHAVQWYARFQSVYTRDDALAKRVALRIEVANARIDRIAEARRAALRGQWIDLIATTYKPDAHALGESLDLINGEIVTGGRGAFALPVAPPGNYELRVRLTMHEDATGLSLYFPVGQKKRAATFHYAINNNTTSSIEGLDEQDTRPASKNKPGRPVELVFQAAAMPDGKLGLAMLIDGQESLKWLGSWGNVDPNEELMPPEEIGRAIFFTCEGKATFHSIELRERD